MYNLPVCLKIFFLSLMHCLLMNILAQQILFLYTKEFYSSKKAFKSFGRDSFILVKQ